MHKNYPVERVDISNGFGDVGWRIHHGVDFRPKVYGVVGDPVYATHDGFVVWAKGTKFAAGNPWEQLPNNGNNGNSIILKAAPPNHATHTMYCHLDKILVREGQYVKAGQQIGTMGCTGYVLPEGTGGTHLHWEMFIDYSEGEYPPNTFYGRVNPLEYMDKPVQVQKPSSSKENKVTPAQLQAILDAIAYEGDQTRKVLTQDYYLGRGKNRRLYPSIATLLNRVLGK